MLAIVQKHFIIDFSQACIFLKLVSITQAPYKRAFSYFKPSIFFCMKSLFFTKINHLSQYCVDSKVFQVPFTPEFIVYESYNMTRNFGFLESMIFQLWLFLFTTWYWTSMTASQLILPQEKVSEKFLKSFCFFGLIRNQSLNKGFRRQIFS